MAKTSSIQRNLKRIRLEKKFSKKRAALVKIIKNRKLTLDERFTAQLKLAKIPRNSAKTRIRNRCEITGRSRGCVQKIKDFKNSFKRAWIKRCNTRNDKIKLVKNMEKII